MYVVWFSCLVVCLLIVLVLCVSFALFFSILHGPLQVLFEPCRPCPHVMVLFLLLALIRTNKMRMMIMINNLSLPAFEVGQTLNIFNVKNVFLSAALT